ncbi:MAG: hypothetical protein AB1444_07260 [Spirochaetota bacterium]
MNIETTMCMCHNHLDELKKHAKRNNSIPCCQFYWGPPPELLKLANAWHQTNPKTNFY